MALSAGRATDPRRIAYVIASMITGGTQTHLLQVLRFLDRSRFAPSLFVLRDAGNLLGQARSLDLPVRTFGMSGTLRDPRDLRGLASMTTALRELRPQLVHGYLLRGNFYAAVAGRLAAVPAVVTSKRGLHRPSGAAERLAVRVSNSLSHAVTGNSQQVLRFTREVEGKIRAPLVMIPSGIDAARFDPQAVGVEAGRRLRAELGIGNAPLVGTAITFRPKKGFRLLFEAMAELLKSVPDAHLAVAGESEMAPEPAALVEQLGLAARVHLLGRRADMPAVLSALDVFVLPSQSEGMSNAVLEAMAMQLPVVATAVGGTPEVIEEGRSGFLTEARDAVSMAARVAALLRDPQLRVGVGACARERILATYCAPAMVRQMEELYARLLDGKNH
ncbi:MAG: glycosyltransferase [Deltaproteobacteria bacterium]|nr:glycosyltransferase [Deltaproteobacteria bacterium]